MAIALNQQVPPLPAGGVRHPVMQNVCAFSDGTIMTFDPRIKQPVWYVAKGIINTHGRRQSQFAKKMRLHYQIVYECFTQTQPAYHSKDGTGLTIDHIDGDKDNNAFSNLRLVTLRENVRRSHCTSGLPYAVRQRSNGTYRVVLRVGGRMTHMGTFKTLDSAIAGRDNFLTGAQHGA